MGDKTVEEIFRRLEKCSALERREVFQALRKEFPIHELEAKFGATAEAILGAISRGGDFTQRGMQGMIAELEFGSLISSLPGWTTLAFEGDLAYDYLLEDAFGAVRVQVKRQRVSHHAAMIKNKMFVAEIQRTRNGRDADGNDTRPYRFGEFDILAVCMQPSSGKWSDFMYTVGRWLIPRISEPACIQVMQYIPESPNDDWTASLSEAVSNWRSPVEKVIAGHVTGASRARTKTESIDRARD